MPADAILVVTVGVSHQALIHSPVTALQDTMATDVKVKSMPALETLARMVAHAQHKMDDLSADALSGSVVSYVK